MLKLQCQALDTHKLVIQSNLSKPNPDKTKHLPKPNDFRGPDIFPYYFFVKKPWIDRNLSKPNTERLFGPILLFSL